MRQIYRRTGHAGTFIRAGKLRRNLSKQPINDAKDHRPHQQRYGQHREIVSKSSGHPPTLPASRHRTAVAVELLDADQAAVSIRSIKRLNRKPFAVFTRPKTGLPQLGSFTPSRNRFIREQVLIADGRSYPHMPARAAKGHRQRQGKRSRPNGLTRYPNLSRITRQYRSSGSARRRASALQGRVAQAPVTAALLDPFQIAERAVTLVLVVGVDAGFQAGLSGRLA